jgi:iron complex transport system substrate-binding protein
MRTIMNSKISILIISLVIALSATSAMVCASVQFTDTAGDSISLPAVAQRVICLNSDCAESMIVLGAGDNVVGIAESVIARSDLMPHLPNAVSVGKWDTPSIEQILELKPDIVISYSTSKPKNADQLQSAGIPRVYLDFYKIDTIEQDIAALSTIIGKESAAEQYLKLFTGYKTGVETAVAENGQDAVPTVYIEGYSDYTAQGKNSGSDQIVTLSKGKNIADSLSEQYPKVTPEWIVNADPDVILKVVSIKSDKTLEDSYNQIIGRTGFDTLSAVKENRVYVLNTALLYGPRSPAGLIAVAKMLHPDTFKDMHPEDFLKEYAGKYVLGADQVEIYAPISQT